MKSVNVKKIIALAMGAVMVGSAGAITVDNSLGNLQYFGANGEPAVQIVLGSQSSASDGVMAANIAATIGNLAYKNSEVTVLGLDGLSCSTANNGGDVVATINYPDIGLQSSYLMKSYVEDRVDSQSESIRDTSLFFNGHYTDLGNARKITSDQTSVLALPNNGEVENSRNLFVKQNQEIYFGVLSTYDETDGVVGKEAKVVYQTTFSDSLPACWNTNYKYGDCTDSNKMDYVHTKIGFMGDEWVVTSFSLSGGDFKSISLGKETSYEPMMTIGDEAIASNGVKVKLIDVSSFGFGEQNEPKVTFKLYDEDGDEISPVILSPKETYSGNGINLHVYDAMAGVAGTSVVEMSLFSNVMTLSDGQRISESNDWNVELFSANNEVSEGLQKIVVYEPSGIHNMEEGESFNIIDNFEGYKITFNGLEDVQRDSLVLNVNKGMNLPLGNSTYLNGDFILVSSGKNTAFSFEGDSINRDSVLVLAKKNGVYQVGTIFYQSNGGEYKSYYSAGELPYEYSSTEKVTLKFESDVIMENLDKVIIPEFSEEYSSIPHSKWGISYDPVVKEFGDTTYNADTVDNEYVSWRGSILSGDSSSSKNIQYALEGAYTTYSLSKTIGNAPDENEVTAGAGEFLLNQDGYSVFVKAINGEFGYTLQGVSGVQPSVLNAQIAYDLSTVSNLVVLDNQNVDYTKTIIAVGGQLVNSVTAEFYPDGIQENDEPIVKVVGNKIIVAGYTAADTVTASHTLIDWLNNNLR